MGIDLGVVNLVITAGSFVIGGAVSYALLRKEVKQHGRALNRLESAVNNRPTRAEVDKEVEKAIASIGDKLTGAIALVEEQSANNKQITTLLLKRLVSPDPQ